jgi:PhnB protein
MKNQFKTTFAPMLYIPTGTIDIDFYKKAFGAILLRRFSTIDGAMFHLHEENYIKKAFSPLSCNGTTTNIGLTVDDVDKVMAQAIAAGAKEISPAQNYDYGFRQGDITDPFGHRWTIQKSI